jgi:hypothetical protein
MYDESSSVRAPVYYGSYGNFGSGTLQPTSLALPTMLGQAPLAPRAFGLLLPRDSDRSNQSYHVLGRKLIGELEKAPGGSLHRTHFERDVGDMWAAGRLIIGTSGEDIGISLLATASTFAIMRHIWHRIDISLAFHVTSTEHSTLFNSHL